MAGQEAEAEGGFFIFRFGPIIFMFFKSPCSLALFHIKESSWEVDDSYHLTHVAFG